MQNLFPQEGETVPKYRFPEFVNDGEWVFEQFDKVYSFLVTNSFLEKTLTMKMVQLKIFIMVIFILNFQHYLILRKK